MPYDENGKYYRQPTNSVNKDKKSSNTSSNKTTSKSLTTNKKNTKNSNLTKAFYLRQQDIGWGYAFAHLIPFVGIFYAFSRKTITPLFIGIGVNLSIRFLVVILMLASGEEEATFFYQLSQFVTTPIAVKVGITKARIYAKKRLDEIE